MRSKPSYDPMRDLILNLRTAAAQIDFANARVIAAREADRIPKSKTELARGAKAKFALMGRQQMRALPDLEPERYPDAIMVLRGCADALDSRFEVTSETQLGQRARHSAA